MKNYNNYTRGYLATLIFCCVFILQSTYAQELSNYAQFKGEVIDSETKDPVDFATLKVDNTNISTVTNSEGNFLLKVPKAQENGTITITRMGYKGKTISLSEFSTDKIEILLFPKITELSEVNVMNFKDPENLVRKVFEKKAENNLNSSAKMTAFYRETIKRRTRNVSLTEAVVNLYKQPYSSAKDDKIELHKARKNTDYRRLDTVALKLQGGPFSTLYLDIMKYPEFIFTDTSISEYSYWFDAPTTINGKTMYVVNFTKEKNNKEPYFEGQLFIDNQTLALTSAVYKMNITNWRKASQIFVKRKPAKIRVYPLEARYKVDYTEQDGKWHYSYGNVFLEFKVDERGKLFNSRYSLQSEMAVTDWEATNVITEPKNALHPTVVMSDEVSGFSDPDFWGPYNVIEPEKSIESAIDKIQRKIERSKD